MTSVLFLFSFHFHSSTQEYFTAELVTISTEQSQWVTNSTEQSQWVTNSAEQSQWVTNSTGQSQWVTNFVCENTSMNPHFLLFPFSFVSVRLLTRVLSVFSDHFVVQWCTTESTTKNGNSPFWLVYSVVFCALTGMTRVLSFLCFHFVYAAVYIYQCVDESKCKESILTRLLTDMGWLRLVGCLKI